MSSSVSPDRVRRLPLSGALRLGRPSEIWFKPALSVVVASAPPHLTLLALARLDLAMYAMAGSLCALYAHHLPYAARARTLALLVLGMLAGLATALVTASLTTDPVLLVTVGALLAAVQKALCDASRIGPPANVVLAFVTSAALFVPQTPAQVPAHLAVAAVTGVWAWLVCMAPGLLRRHAPAHRATAQAQKAVDPPTLWSRLGPVTPLAVRTALGCALAGYASLALGVGRPYWALVTAASLYQANLTLTWNRTVQRVVGTFVGVLAFAALAPLAHLDPTTLVLCCLALSFGAEALISRNYWLGMICVTPMALLVTEFTRYESPTTLITDRLADTVVGALVGLAVATAAVPRLARPDTARG